MKRFVKLILVVAVLLVLAYFGGSALLDRGSRRALPRLARQFEAKGFVVSELDFERARLGSFRSVVWDDITGVVQMPPDSAAGGQAFRLSVAAIELSLTGFSGWEMSLEVRDLIATSEAGLSDEFAWASSRFRAAAQGGEMLAPLLRVGLEIDPRKPGPGIQMAIGELGRVIGEGRTSLPVEVDAGVLTRLEGDELWASLLAVEVGGETKIEIDREDLRRQADRFSRPLTDGEIDLVAENPLRAPAMLLVKKYAEKTAKQANDDDPDVPEDAYRHVLWSYLLTRRFGAEFAEQVTDAHEVGSTTNTEADHRMDYNNNAVGRRYAASGVREVEILDRVRSDPRVIQRPA